MTHEAAPQTFPLPRTCPFGTPAEYRRLRAEEPVSRVTLPTGQSAWALTRLADARAMLTSPHFSANRQNPAFPLLFEGERVDPDAPLPMASQDPPEHTAARRALISEFTVPRTKTLLPRIQAIVDDRIDAMLAGPAAVDLVRALALPVPSLVICDLLGVPYADHVFFEECSSTTLSRSVTADQRLDAVMRLYAYLGELVAAKAADPGDDLLGRQILRQRESGEVDTGTLVSTSLLLLIAGHESTANMISLGTLALLADPDRFAAIRADAGKTPGAVEELLRFFSISEVTPRLAMADVEIGGTLIRAGDGVIALNSIVNRDADTFADPDELDIERDARQHIAFGFGVHQCLGQNLARAELRIVFDTLATRIPGLRLAAGIDELPFKDALTYGLHELPVTW
ncbi:cytochrome P450 [Amycolatopsis sp. A1MSW2902]|uniref:cytochrome P450 n=1 Tax=Amycolatopsis sp. A1MSW2902 TaxID=687413 RepID=UPI00307D50DC